MKRLYDNYSEKSNLVPAEKLAHTAVSQMCGHSNAVKRYAAAILEYSLRRTLRSPSCLWPACTEVLYLVIKQALDGNPFPQDQTGVQTIGSAPRISRILMEGKEKKSV